jgi:hypothetical protein
LVRERQQTTVRIAHRESPDRTPPSRNHRIGIIATGTGAPLDTPQDRHGRFNRGADACRQGGCPLGTIAANQARQGGHGYAEALGGFVSGHTQKVSRRVRNTLASRSPAKPIDNGRHVHPKGGDFGEHRGGEGQSVDGRTVSPRRHCMQLGRFFLCACLLFVTDSSF